MALQVSHHHGASASVGRQALRVAVGVEVEWRVGVPLVACEGVRHPVAGALEGVEVGELGAIVCQAIQVHTHCRGAVTGLGATTHVACRAAVACKALAGAFHADAPLAGWVACWWWHAGHVSGCEGEVAGLVVEVVL